MNRRNSRFTAAGLASNPHDSIRIRAFVIDRNRPISGNAAPVLPIKNGNPEEEVQPVDLEAVVVRREELQARSGKPRFDLALYFTNLENSTRDQIQTYLDQK